MSSQAVSPQAVSSRPFTAIAATVFALIAFGHVLRLAFDVEVVIGGMIVPMGVSLPVVVIAAGMAILLWRESRG